MRFQNCKSRNCFKMANAITYRCSNIIAQFLSTFIDCIDYQSVRPWISNHSWKYFQYLSWYYSLWYLSTNFRCVFLCAAISLFGFLVFEICFLIYFIHRPSILSIHFLIICGFWKKVTFKMLILFCISNCQYF